ncbi:MAG: FtsQ-type POTRA domain-containing protein [Actinomycetota bacterium]|nr:FtsQ-type POTRA domain-containing protein [Actinomycetota bacterium]
MELKEVVKMDPRLHRRRVEVRREEGRHRLRVLVAITVVVVTGCAAWGVTRSPLLDVDRIVVTGASHVTPEQVRAASGLRRGEALTDVDATTSARGVETLPWVQATAVSRHWPSQVVIRVTERSAVAATTAADRNRFALLDRSGQVLDVVDTAPAGMVVLAGIPPAGPPGTHLGGDGLATLSVAVALPPALAGRTAGVEPTLGAAGEVDLRLTPDGPGGMVKLGPPQDLARKFDAVAAVLAQVDVHNLAVLDVSRPDTPVLTRREGSTKVSTPRTG